jgi:hypothetical protein
MQAMNHAQMHLLEAVGILATETGLIKDRLRYAADPLFKAEMNFSEIPVALQGEYKALCSDLVAVDDAKRGSLAATIEGLSEDDASRLAGRIVRLFVNSLLPDEPIA